LPLLAIAESMTSMGYFTRIILLASTTIIVAVSAAAQAGAPSSIQVFMPGGSLPDRALRFELNRDDGRIETLFTDNKGKFLLTGDLVRDADYIIRVQGDGRTFASTVVTFRTFRNIVIYVPVFLNAIENNKKKASPPVLNVIDLNVPADARAAYDQAMSELKNGEKEKPIASLKRALSIYPAYVRALNDLGVLYMQNGRLDEAATAFRRAIKLNPNFVYPRLNLGVVLNRQSKFIEAVEILAKVYEENAQLNAARLPYAIALLETGRLDEAEKLLRSAVVDMSLSESTRAEAYFRLGAIMNRRGQFAEAANQFEGAIKLQPKMVMAHLQLGGAFLELKNLAAAERELLKAYELGGASAGAAQFLLGQTYYLAGKYEPAVAAFEKYLIDVPNAPNAAQVRDAIARIRTALKQKASASPAG
jgi:Flp pilus assembly protein TadD